jgi:integrase
MQKKITSRLVETIPLPQGRRLEIWDQILPGFGVRVSKTGRKVWFCVVRVSGRNRRITLGSFPVLSLAAAREKAQACMKQAQLGELDPAESSSPTLGRTIPKFIELYARPRNRGWKETERLLNQKFSSLFNKRLDEIRRSDVVSILDEMVVGGAPGRANHALAAIKKLMNWSVDRGMIELNPIAGVKPPTKIIPRERILSDQEIARFMEAAKAEGYPFGTIYQILVLTAQRRGEVTSMRWSEIDFERAVWVIPGAKAKNGLVHEVPLSSSVMALLLATPRFQGSDFVFTTTGTTPVSGLGKVRYRVERAVGAFDWWVHDLRRTAASGMARLGTAPHVIEKVLNHKSGLISGVAAVYNRYGYEREKREALQLWANHLSEKGSLECRTFGRRSTLITKPAGKYHFDPRQIFSD